jgi:glyoxalase family protein
MELRGIHHITAITADARANLGFYAGTLGLRFIKKTVNFDDPTAYHLYYGDDAGTPGSILTFFEYPGVGPGSAGHGMIHRITWRVADERALDFWDERLRQRGVSVERHARRLRFSDPEGLGLELAAAASDERPLTAWAEGIPPQFALQRFEGVRAYATQPDRSARILAEALQFTPQGAVTDGGEQPTVLWRVTAGGRSSSYICDPAPPWQARQGAGTVHHIAWATPAEQQAPWRERVAAAGLSPTQIIDRTYFQSVYFREPGGVLFEIATLGPGFAIDEPLEHLGERLQLPPRYERLRPQLERELTPLENPRRVAA